MSAIPIDAGGRFCGYASVFNRRDSGGDIVLPGAFAKSLAKRGERIRLLFQHDPKEPVGIWESLREDAHGLFVTGRLVPGVPQAEALRRLIGRGRSMASPSVSAPSGRAVAAATGCSRRSTSTKSRSSPFR